VTFGDVFVCLFLLSLVCASVSTISALMHTIGVAGGYDLWSLIESRKKKMAVDSKSIRVNRIVTVVVLVLVIVYCYLMPASIIAKATSLFMGMSACALLPAFVMALHSKKPRRDAAITSISVGTVSYLFWALFINTGMSVFMPICKWITGNEVLFPDSLLAYVDPLIVALPLSALTLVAVWLIRRNKEDLPEDAMPVSE
jgi:SSS family solute:Na+ symporter